MLSGIHNSIKEYTPCKHAYSWAKSAVETAKDPLNSLKYKVGVTFLKAAVALVVLAVELALFTPVKTVHYTATGIYHFSSNRSGKLSDTSGIGIVDDESEEDQVDDLDDGVDEQANKSGGSGRQDRTSHPSHRSAEPSIVSEEGEDRLDGATPGSEDADQVSETTHQVQTIHRSSTTQSSTQVMYRNVTSISSSSSSHTSSSSSSSFRSATTTHASSAKLALPIARLAELTTKSADRVIIPRLSFGAGMGTHISAPWGFLPLEVEKKQMFYIDIEGEFEDGSVPGGFLEDAKLKAFQKKHKVTFPLHLSAEHEVTLTEAQCIACGIPGSAKAFHFIYPGALNMKFENKTDDTPQNRAKILEAMKTGLSLEMSLLLTVGGYLYHAEANWRNDPSDPTGQTKTRDLAGINVLMPGGNPSDKKTKHLYFGQAKIVPESIVAKLAVAAGMTDRYYDALAKKKSTIVYPAMSPITVGDLITKMQLSHFKWLEPKHEWIQAVCDEIDDPDFGANGVFVYYSKEKPALSCMLPVVAPDEWKKLLRNTSYLELDGDNETEAVTAFTAEECSVCMEKNEENIDEKGVARKIARFNPCNHMNTCASCYDGLVQSTQWGKPKCPSCRAPIEDVDYPSQKKGMAFKPHTDLKEFTLGYAKLGVDYLRSAQNGALADLLEKEKFSSPITPVTPALRKALNIPANVTHTSFLYPVYGRGYDSTSPYLSAIQAELNVEEGQALSRDQQLLKGLVSNGGYVFYDRNERPQFIYSILPQESKIKPEHSLKYKTESLNAGEIQTLDREVTKAKDFRVDKYNVCKTTLKSLLAFARRFSSQNEDFFYQTGSKKETYWKAKLVTVN